MRRALPEIFTFTREEPEAVVAHMDRLGAAHKGWINLYPQVSEEDEPDPPGALAEIFSASGPEVPVCTWLAGKARRKGIEPDSIGIEHGAGPKVVTRLANLGVPVPEGWRRRQDHPRRGLVVTPPVGARHGEELSWMLEAAAALSRVRLTGRWEARVRSG